MSGKRRLGLTLPSRVAGLAAQLALGRARLHRPAVVDVHIHVAMINHAGAYHRVGRLADDLVRHVVLPDVPAIPAHVRRERERVSADDPERAAGLDAPVGDLEDDVVSSGAVEPAADLAGLRVEPEPLGKAYGRVPEGTLAGGRDLEQERRAGPDAEDIGAVDAGLRARPGRQDRGVGGPRPPRGQDPQGQDRRPGASRRRFIRSSCVLMRITNHVDADRSSSWASISSRVFPLVSGRRRRMKTNPSTQIAA